MHVHVYRISNEICSVKIITNILSDSLWYLPKILLGLDDFELIVTGSEIRAAGLNNLYYHIRRTHDEKLIYRRDSARRRS